MSHSFLYTAQNLSEITPQLPLIKSMGIEVIMNYGCGDTGGATYIMNDDDKDDYFDLCATEGLKIMFNLRSYAQNTYPPNYTAIDTYINRYKDHSALFGYYAGEEFLYSVPQTYVTRRAVYNHIKALDNKPIMETSSTGAPDYQQASHDIQGIEIYSSYNGYTNQQIIDSATSMLNTYNSVVDASDNVCPIIQTFGGYMTFMLPPDGVISQIWSIAESIGVGTMWGAGFFVWGYTDNAWTFIKDTPYLINDARQIVLNPHANFGAGGTGNLGSGGTISLQ